MSEGQRLRWWNEASTVEAARAAALPPGQTETAVTETAVREEPPVEYLDIGEELEAEARRRADVAQTAAGESLVITPSPELLVRRLRRRTLLCGLPVALACLLVNGVLAATVGLPRAVIAFSLFPLVELALLYVLMARKHRRQTRPVVTLTPEGIVVHMPMQDIGLIRWDEIADIRAYTLLYRYVGIVPRDVKALARRLGPRRARLIRMNEACNRLFYKPLRRPVAPINIPQEYLPISADALVARIAAYEANQRG